MTEETDLIRIEGIFDPLSGHRDGVITPCAPLFVKVHSSLPMEDERVKFYLRPEEGGELIPVSEVYVRTGKKVIVLLPNLPPGRYHPVVTVPREGAPDLQSISSGVVWTVLTAFPPSPFRVVRK